MRLYPILAALIIFSLGACAGGSAGTGSKVTTGALPKYYQQPPYEESIIQEPQDNCSKDKNKCLKPDRRYR